jgi:DNA mismatch endonuclease (patch repair protein)
MLAKKNLVSVPRYANFRPRSAETSRVGASNRREDTIPEVLLRSALRARGVRYRSNVNSLPGCPDLILVQHRIAVFCDGDFWHGRNWAVRKSKLGAGWNAAYWVAKIERNRQRDREVTRALKRIGWRVIRVWESDVRGNPGRVARRILSSISTTISRSPSRSEVSTSARQPQLQPPIG